jgi:hypothetical protein
MAAMPAHLPVHAVACAALLGAATTSATASAGDAVTLRWSAPEGCPGAAALRADLEQLAGRPLVWDGPDALVVDAQVTRVEDVRWTLQLSLTPPGSPASVRAVEGRRCDELARATVSILALALDPILVEPARPQPAKPTPPAPPPSPPPTPTRPAEPARPVESVAGGPLVFGGIDAVALPGVSAVLGVGAFASIRDHRLELRGLTLLPREGELDDTSGGTFLLLAGALRYCHRLVGQRPSLRACAGFEAGAMNGEGYGFDRNVAQTGLWLAPTLAAGLAVPLGDVLGVSLDVEGLVPLVRDRYRLDGADVVHRPMALDVRVLLGFSAAAFH